EDHAGRLLGGQLLDRGEQRHAGHLRHHEVAQDQLVALAGPNRLRLFRPSPTQVTLYSDDRARRSAPRIIGSSSTTSSLPPCAAASGAGVVTRSPGASITAAGRVTRKVLPRPISLSTPTLPPSASRMPLQIQSPRPVPSLAGLVVKKGSKIRSRISAGSPSRCRG